MLRSARAEQTSVTEASKLFGFSREQFYKLERLFLARGYVSLLGSPRGRRPLIALNTEIISFIIHKKLEMPALEMEDLHAQIQNEFKVECSLRTVTRAMEKAGIPKGGPRSR
jgi:transposase